MQEIRLQKFMANAGVCSRRHAEEMIAAGKVKVNSKTVTELGTKIDPDFDKVEVGGELIRLNEKKYYIMLNKPSGYITTAQDTHGRNTVMDLVTELSARIYPVGRLDADTEGLLLLTNDGEFANRVMHPSKNMTKVYIAQVKGMPSLNTLKTLATGVDIGDYVTSPGKAELVKGNQNVSTVKIEIGEGKKRQVRRMLDAVGHPVISLKRVQIGPIMLGNLPLGRWRHLREEEINRLVR